MSNKTKTALFILVLLLPSILLAAMSDSKAMTEAKKIFGPMANIAQVRGPVDTYWTKQIGVQSKGCNKDFTAIGEGSNTWEAAFAAIPPGVVKGPYSGKVQLISIAWDDTGVTGFQWIIDGANLGLEITKDPVPLMLNVNVEWDTASGPQGVHVLCAWAKDAAGNIGRSKAIVVLLDQTKPSISTTIELLNKTGEPSTQR